MRYACFFVQAGRCVIQSLAVTSLHHQVYLVRWVCYLYSCLPSSVFDRMIQSLAGLSHPSTTKLICICYDESVTSTPVYSHLYLIRWDMSVSSSKSKKVVESVTSTLVHSHLYSIQWDMPVSSSKPKQVGPPPSSSVFDAMSLLLLSILICIWYDEICLFLRPSKSLCNSISAVHPSTTKLVCLIW
jgi:hypothetical protein